MALLNCFKINYQKLGTSIPLSKECLKEKEEKYQLISIYFEVESEDDKRFAYSFQLNMRFK